MLKMRCESGLTLFCSLSLSPPSSLSPSLSGPQVRIERGMEDGRKIVFKEKADEMPGAITGDVILVVSQVSCVCVYVCVCVCVCAPSFIHR